ncbi:MAG: PIN domain-containing protein [Chloroflexi bacterium]|nr:PIN domain-containing protein [Chloroflexota bacterium]MBI4197841.1 PIN domain-containing protein [Chloroflexota bacterium]
MAKYLLDTTVLIDYFYGSTAVIALVTSLTQDDHRLGVCGINVAEFYAGLTLPQRREADEFVDTLEFYPITAQEAKLAGQFRHDFARRGTAINLADAVIAAVAVEEKATLITDNLRHFPMPELQVMPQPPRTREHL